MSLEDCLARINTNWSVIKAKIFQLAAERDSLLAANEEWAKNFQGYIDKTGCGDCLSCVGTPACEVQDEIDNMLKLLSAHAEQKGTP